MSTSAVAAAAKATAILAGDGSDRINTPELGEEFGRHFLLTPDMQSEIKNEPSVDIDDTHPECSYNDSNSDGGMGRGGEGNGNSNGTGGSDSPKIRMIPTVKLMSLPKPKDPKRKFVCPYDNCTKSYGKSSHLRSHLTWHTGIKPFVCQDPSCGKGFTRSDELNRHVRTHTGEKPFECIQCTKKFSRSDHLTKHLATHAKQMKSTAAKRLRAAAYEDQAQLDSSGGESGFNAGFSGGAEEPDVKKVLMDMQNPAEHMSLSDGMKFMSALIDASKAIDVADGGPTVLGLPFRAQHLEEGENLTEEPGMGHQPIKIKLERPEHSGEYHVVPVSCVSGPTQTSHATPAQPPPPLTPRPQLQPYHSQQHTSSKEHKALHRSPAVASTDCAPPSMSLEIKAEPRDDVLMPEANAPSPLPHNAAIMTSGLIIPPHFQDYPSQTSNAPERPFHCAECTKRFKRQDDLNRHVRTHTGEKPYVCNECDRRFVRSDHLKKHMKTHTKVQAS